MKNLLMVLTVIAVMTSCTTTRVQTQPGYESYNRVRQSFYYYPSANVYFDGSCNRYIYNRGGSWITASVLPSDIFIGNEKRYQVYYNGPEVWRDNQAHRNTYYRQPEVGYDRRYEDRRDRKRDGRYN